MLSAGDLQAGLPQHLQLPADMCQAPVLQRRAELRSQVRRSRELRCTLRSGGVRSGQLRRPVRSCGLRSGQLLCSVQPQVRCIGDVRRALRSGSGELRRAVRSGSGQLRCSVRSGSGLVRRSVRSGSGQVLRQRLPEAVLCRSLRSCPLDL